MTTKQLAQLLSACGIIDAAAVEDPEGCDNYATLDRVELLRVKLQESEETTTENMTRRKAYVCKSCGGVYADDPVSQCDCMPEKNEFYIGTITYSEL